MLLDALIDEFELRIAIGVRGAFGGLVRRLKAVARRVQELPHLLRTDTKPLLQELACQLPCALGRPAKRRLGVAARDGVDSDSNASTNCGLVSSRRGLPPPGRRTWTTSSARAPPRSSSRPPRIVVRDIPVARSTAAIPPSPYASASAPAHRRFSRSSITGSSALNFVRISHSVAAISAVDHTSTALSIPAVALKPKIPPVNGLFLTGALLSVSDEEG